LTLKKKKKKIWPKETGNQKSGLEKKRSWGGAGYGKAAGR